MTTKQADGTSRKPEYADGGQFGTPHQVQDLPGKRKGSNSTELLDEIVTFGEILTPDFMEQFIADLPPPKKQSVFKLIVDSDSLAQEFLGTNDPDSESTRDLNSRELTLSTRPS